MEETTVRQHINAANDYARLYKLTGNPMFRRLENSRRRLASKWVMFNRKWDTNERC